MTGKISATGTPRVSVALSWTMSGDIWGMLAVQVLKKTWISAGSWLARNTSAAAKPGTSPGNRRSDV